MGTKRKIGFVGCPPEEIISLHRDCELIDLDNSYPGVKQEISGELLPTTTCKIIKRILDNAVAIKPEIIILDDGYSKCDNARFLGIMLEDIFKGKCEIIRTQNDSTNPRGTPICDSNLPLSDKVGLILDSMVDMSVIPEKIMREANPPAAFWGVPCADDAVYKLFPAGTQILGWIRCFENGTPADLDLESWVPENVPTVFFAQTFCSKNILAKYLADRHNGLYVDSDGTLGRSERAKIEAFLHFRSKGH